VVARGNNEKEIINYLLNSLGDEEQTRVEKRFLSDIEYRETIKAIEDDLVDEYVKGELPTPERKLFEKRIASLPHWQQKIEFAKALSTSVEDQDANMISTTHPNAVKAGWSLWTLWRMPRRALTLSLAGVAVLLLVGGTWLLVEQIRTRSEQANSGRQTQPQSEATAKSSNADGRATPVQPQGQQPQKPKENTGESAVAGQAQSERVPSDQPQPRATKPSRPTVAAFVFAPGLARSSSEAEKLNVPEGTQLVRLRLELESGDEYQFYRVEVRDARGILVWNRGNLRRSRSAGAGGSVILDLPADTIPSGEYELRLAGANGKEKPEDLGYYYFTILKK
jgi:hypothetical protein